MGLTWTVCNKVKSGRRSEAEELGKKLEGIDVRLHEIYVTKTDPPYEEKEFNTLDEVRELREGHAVLLKQIIDCVIPAIETLGALRVGHDAAADAFAAAQWLTAQDNLEGMSEEAKAYWSTPQLEWLKGQKGKYVPELLPDAVQASEKFPAHMLNHCSDIIGDDLLTLVHTNMEADEMLLFSQKMMIAANDYAKANSLEWVNTARKLPEAELVKKLSANPDLRFLLHVYDAARWTGFWGIKGHSILTTV